MNAALFRLAVERPKWAIQVIMLPLLVIALLVGAMLRPAYVWADNGSDDEVTVVSDDGAGVILPAHSLIRLQVSAGEHLMTVRASGQVIDQARVGGGHRGLFTPATWVLNVGARNQYVIDGSSPPLHEHAFAIPRGVSTQFGRAQENAPALLHWPRHDLPCCHP